MNAKRPGDILLIEDDENDIILMQRAFRKAKLDIDINIIRDGDAAVDYFDRLVLSDFTHSANFPWLIILDLKLPCRSGLEVLAWIRQHPQLKVIPIVVLTASNESADICKAYELHVNSYLIKPINFEDLVQMAKLIKTYWLGVNIPPCYFPETLP